MPNLILQAVIDNRRALLLDLVREIKGRNPKELIGEDIYVIGLPEVTTPILQVKKATMVQSLIDTIEDVSIQDLTVQFFKDEEKGQYILQFGDDGKSEFTEYFIEPSLSIEYQEIGDDVTLCLTKYPNSQRLKFGSFEIEIRLLNKTKLYHTLLTFHYANAGDIMQTGLDFGSESSQIMDGRGDRIEANPFDLFESIKSYIKTEEKDDTSNYIQKDMDNPFFYRSLFYAKKEIESGLKTITDDEILMVNVKNDLNIITDQKLIDKDEKAFFNEWVQVPNIKLIGNNIQMNQDFIFRIINENQTYTRSLQELKEPIYAGLLDGMLSSYLKTTIQHQVLLRFTLLVPNIYNIERVNNAKKILRYIIEKFDLENGKKIKGVEITTVSESDAAFLGAMNNFSVKKGHYYIIIDCGKGTTDYSIVSTIDGTSFKSEYRNGFAGAGNLISFGILQSILSFMKEFSKNDKYDSLVGSFIENNLTDGPANYFKNFIHTKIESFKRNYDPSKPRTEIENHWLEVITGSFKLENLFTNYDPNIKNDFSINNVFISLLEKINYVYDWHNFISNSYNIISEKIRENIDDVIQHLNKTMKCDGILLTGRGFYFNPLRVSLSNALKQIKGLNENHFIDTNEIDLKKVCMTGIFNRQMIAHSDIIATPIEVKAGTNRRLKKKDMKSNSSNKWLLDICSKIEWDWLLDIIYDNDGEHYSEESNKIPVINLDLINCHFWAGGNIYKVPIAVPGTIKDAYVTMSRKGLYIIIEMANGTKKCIKLEADLNLMKNNSKDIYQSLFPGYFKKEYLDTIK